MKKFEVTVISKEIVKPSSPTPDFLRKHHLSYLDQISPPLYIPLIFFYPNPINGVEISNRLKKSLSEALTRFYPLAGKLVNRLYVDCNDDGVDFFEAKVDIELSEIVSNPIPDELNKFLPYEPNELRDFCMAVQISFLNCGSMAVALVISHKIADAKSLCTFAYSWAAISSGSSLELEPAGLKPKFDVATIFPPIGNNMIFSHSDDDVMFKEKPVTKMFTFPISKVNALREKYYANRKNGGNRWPTRVEALSTFIWSRLVASTQVKYSNPDKTVCSSIGMVVNLRPRFDPLADCFGNLWWLTGAMFKIKDKEYEKESFHVVEKLGEAIRKVNGDYVAKLREGYSCDYTPNKVDNEEEPVRFGFTSFCRFPLYEVDFGWGEPIWVSSARWGICNVVSFLDNRLGDGIEAWVNLNKEDMAKFEQDEVMREFVSSTPSLRLSCSIKTHLYL